jgi:hypothetical protein
MEAMHTIEYKGEKLIVIGNFYIGSLGNCEDLPEPRRFEIKSIFADGHSITAGVEKDDLDEIEVLLLEENYDF